MVEWNARHDLHCSVVGVHRSYRAGMSRLSAHCRRTPFLSLQFLPTSGRRSLAETAARVSVMPPKSFPDEANVLSPTCREAAVN